MLAGGLLGVRDYALQCVNNVGDAALTRLTAQHDALGLQMANASGAVRDGLYERDRSIQKLLAAVGRCRQPGAPVTEDIWKVYAELLQRPCVVVKHANWTKQDLYCFEATEYTCGWAAPDMDNSRVKPGETDLAVVGTTWTSDNGRKVDQKRRQNAF